MATLPGNTVMPPEAKYAALSALKTDMGILIRYHGKHINRLQYHLYVTIGCGKV